MDLEYKCLGNTSSIWVPFFPASYIRSLGFAWPRWLETQSSNGGETHDGDLIRKKSPTKQTKGNFDSPCLGKLQIAQTI